MDTTTLPLGRDSVVRVHIRIELASIYIAQSSDVLVNMGSAIHADPAGVARTKILSAT